MKVTFPHMGTAYIPFRALIEGLGHEVIVAPACTQRTLSLGTRYAPESACLPLKINIGNYLEAAELGAEAIVMAGGIGPCRFGFYAYVQQEILRDIGCDMEMIILEPPCQRVAAAPCQAQVLDPGCECSPDHPHLAAYLGKTGCLRPP